MSLNQTHMERTLSNSSRAPLFRSEGEVIADYEARKNASRENRANAKRMVMQPRYKSQQHDAVKGRPAYKRQRVDIHNYDKV